ncbi:hypothetical protein [Clostridium sp.]|uniref:hypothetical protein n=1 Tax=Clostridium sp. TaxID=1506 RepID=UPI0026067E30|nr:hypothetical protein [Clostridium sp.]
MSDKTAKEHIARIAKGSAYFIFKNGPVNKLHKENRISDEEIKNMQEYLQNHLAYLYEVLLEEGNLKKYELVMNTMNQFYVNDDTEVTLEDEGFDSLYEQLFPKSSNIVIK